jgi:cytochrome c6
MGEKLFTEEANPPCGLCHRLNAAQSTGTIGPNLDTLKPDRDKIKRAVKNGVGNMPPYGDSLSDAEIEAVSEYVAKAITAQE